MYGRLIGAATTSTSAIRYCLGQGLHIFLARMVAGFARDRKQWAGRIRKRSS